MTGSSLTHWLNPTKRPLLPFDRISRANLKLQLLSRYLADLPFAKEMVDKMMNVIVAVRLFILWERIRVVDINRFVDRIREMASFELGKEIVKDAFSSCHERGTKKKFWVPKKHVATFLSSRHVILPFSRHSFCFLRYKSYWKLSKFSKYFEPRRNFQLIP